MSVQPTQEQSIDAQIATFKGLSTEDGVVTHIQDGERREDDLGGAEGDESAATGEQPPAPKPKGKTAQDRIDQAVKRQREAERERDEFRGRYMSLEERLARIESGGRPLTAPQQTVNTVDPNAPDPSKYQYGELDAQFIRDLARYETRKELEAEKAERDKATRASQEAETAKARRAFFDAGLSKFPDFRETVLDSAQRGEWPLSDVVGNLAFESPIGHDVLYHLATNPDEAKTLAAMSPARQAAWFGALEAKISPAASSAAARQAPSAPVQTTRAPQPPARRVLGAGGAQPQTVTPDTQDFAAFEAMARQQGGRR